MDGHSYTMRCVLMEHTPLPTQVMILMHVLWHAGIHGPINTRSVGFSEGLAKYGCEQLGILYAIPIHGANMAMHARGYT